MQYEQKATLKMSFYECTDNKRLKQSLLSDPLRSNFEMKINSISHITFN